MEAKPPGRSPNHFQWGYPPPPFPSGATGGDCSGPWSYCIPLGIAVERLSIGVTSLVKASASLLLALLVLVMALLRESLKVASVEEQMPVSSVGLDVVNHLAEC